MTASYYIYIVLLVLSIGISGFLISQLARLRKTPGAGNLIWAITAVMVWSFAYIFEIVTVTFVTKNTWSKIEYLGIPFVSVAIFTFALVYSGHAAFLTRGRYVLFTVIPTTTMLLAATNDWHHLLWSDVLMPAGSAFGPLTVGHGFWYNINIVYSYTLLFLATFLFAQIAVRSHARYRVQAILMLIGMIIPWIANFVYIVRLIPGPAIDWTPLALTLTAICLEIGFARFGLMEIVPIAQSLVFNAMEDGVIVADARGKIVEINPAAQTIFRSQEDRLIGQDVRNILPAWVDWEAGAGPTIDAGHEISLGDGLDQRSFNVRISSIQSRRSQITGHVITLIDISEQKQAEEQLRHAHQEALEANRMKTLLLAGISHDLRTPLGAIMGYAEMIQTGVLGVVSENQRHAALEILDSTNQLLVFVNNLINQAQIETGRVVIKDGTFDTSELVEAVESTVSFTAKKKGLALNTEIDPALPVEIHGDPYWLKQILLNLASNAVKFTDNGYVKIYFSKQDMEHWAIHVTDSGIGIASDSQKVIFEPFRQATNSSTRRHSGSGLGLAIVNQLVTLMKGKIELKSEVGHGSTFTVLLPLVAG